MGYETEQRMCSSCGGFGSRNKTEYVANPNPGGRTSMPVTRRETCFTCGGLGTTNHSVYVPDSVPTTPASTDSARRPPKQTRSIWKPPDKGLTPEGHEDLKKARVQSIALVIALSAGVAFYFSTNTAFPTVEQRGMLSVLLLGVMYVTFTKPLRGLTLALAKLVEVTLTLVRTVLKIALWIGIIGLVLYVIKQMG